MKLAIALIHYYPVNPTYLLVEMETDLWRKFLFASQAERQNMIIPKLKPHLVGKVRELVWLPLDGQEMLKIISENDIKSL